jgi:hypothetical protein
LDADGLELKTEEIKTLWDESHGFGKREYAVVSVDLDDLRFVASG